MIRSLLAATVAVALVACNSTRGTTADRSDDNRDAMEMDNTGMAPGENDMSDDVEATDRYNVSSPEMEAGQNTIDNADGLGQDAVDLVDGAEADMNEVDVKREYELDEDDVADAAMDADAVADDAVEDVMERNNTGAANPMSDTDMDMDYDNVTAQGTLDAVGEAGGLTSLAVGTAIQTIDQWIVKLEAANGSTDISTGLRTLRGQLTATSIDGNAVGETLMMLGEKTQEAGDGASDSTVSTLGQALMASGKQLSGM